MNFLKSIAVLYVFFSTFGFAFAEEQGESSLLIEVAVQTNGGGGKSSVTAKQIYAEKALTDEESVWGVVYDDPAFRAMYIGGAKKFGDLQLAVGIGSARYDGKSHFIINPWGFYSKDGVEGYLSAEHYSNESVSPWFVKGYVHKDIAETIFAGVYGESAFGIGPMIGTSFFEKKFKVLASTPVVDRQAGGARLIVRVSYEF